MLARLHNRPKAYGSSLDEGVERMVVMAKAGINIDSVYVSTKGHIVLGVDDVAGAIQIAGGMAVIAFE